MYKIYTGLFWDPPGYLGKLLMMMKLTILVLTIMLMQVSASSLAQKVTLVETDITLERVFREIRKQTGYNVLVRNTNFKLSSRVDVNFRDIPLEEALDQLAERIDLTYIISEKTVIIRKKEKSNGRHPDVPSSGEMTAAQVTVRGTVAGPEGEPLAGVSIHQKGTNKGTATDLDGRFELAVADDNAVLVVSYVGYQTQEVPVEGRDNLTITLQIDVETLDELVVVGYGTQKKVNLTGAVDVISSDQIENRQSATVSQILQGQSPGMNFSVGNNGFQPGASMDIDIRGIGSLNGGSPFVLIDGFPGDMDRLNPNDIESISVLKDAAASAIYGARAPYGVILITTKSGRKNEKMSISYSGNLSVNTPDRLPQMLDSYTFARVINEMGGNGGGKPYSQDAIDRIIAYQQEDWDYLKQFFPADATNYESMPLANGRWGHNQDGIANYDWYDEYFGSSVNQQHNLSIRGGSDKTTYYLSGGFLDQGSVLNYGTDYYKRYNLTGKVSTAVTDWWDFRYETRFMKSPREFPSLTDGWDYHMIFRQIPRTVPTQGKYTGYGEYNVQSKIPFLEETGTHKHETTENWHTLSTEIRPLAGWKINGEFAYRSVGYFRTDHNLTFYEQYVDRSLVPFAGSVPSDIREIQWNNSYWTTNVYSSYDLNLSDHNFSVLAGMQYELTRNNTLNAAKTNLLVPGVPSLQTADGDAVVNDDLTHWSTQGYFGRFTYNFREKYLFEMNARYDGTSRFQRGRRWGFFPSFSAGWNLDKENFWQPIQPVVNTFKVRVSWGQLGNQQVSPYLDLPLIPLVNNKFNWIFNYGDNRPIGYTGTPALVSPHLTWETATTKNLGLNMTFLDHRLQVDFDLYERVTEDMIGPSEPVPGVLGSAVPQSNNATLRSRGWEASLRWNNTVPGSGFSYFLGLNVHDTRTVVTDYLNPSGLVSSWYPGKEAGEIWGYTAHDLFKSQAEVDAYLEEVDMSYINNNWNPGDLKYEDINGDGAVNAGTNSLSDPGDLSIIGNSTPRYQFGFTGGFNLKGFDFSFLIKGTAKRDYAVPVAGEQYVFWGVRNWLFTALTPQHLDYFRDQPGDKYNGLHEGDANINLDAYWPRPYLDQNQNNKNRQPSTRYLLDASYLRLQNAQIGYNFSPQILDKIRLQKLRLYISAENLFTVTDLLKGIDPAAFGRENAIGMTYGADKIFSIGINATL